MEWIVLIAAILLGVPAAAWFAQERLIFFPQPVVTAYMPAEAKPLEIVATDRTRLRGWVRGASAMHAPVVLYFGGNAEEVSGTLADPRWPRDWTIVAINYRGYGASEGTPSEAALVADALVIYDAIVVAHPDVAARRIVAFGRSLGTGVAVKLAAARPLAGVVLVSPFDSLVALGRTHYPWLPVSALLRHRFDSDADSRRIQAPLLAIVADRDSIIPQERSQALYNAWAGPKSWLVVPATDHNSLSAPDSFWAGVAGFLGSLT